MAFGAPGDFLSEVASEAVSVVACSVVEVSDRLTVVASLDFFSVVSVVPSDVSWIVVCSSLVTDIEVASEVGMVVASDDAIFVVPSDVERSSGLTFSGVETSVMDNEVPKVVASNVIPGVNSASCLVDGNSEVYTDVIPDANTVALVVSSVGTSEVVSENIFVDISGVISDVDVLSKSIFVVVISAGLEVVSDILMELPSDVTSVVGNDVLSDASVTLGLTGFGDVASDVAASSVVAAFVATEICDVDWVSSDVSLSSVVVPSVVPCDFISAIVVMVVISEVISVVASNPAVLCDVLILSDVTSVIPSVVTSVVEGIVDFSFDSVVKSEALRNVDFSEVISVVSNVVELVVNSCNSSPLPDVVP